MDRAHQLAFSCLASAALIATAAAAQDPGQGGRRLSTGLTGAAEVPGPGDPDGSGTARITLNPGQSRVCYEIEVEDIAAASGAHIHVGAAGTAPPDNVVVTLGAPATGESEGCVEDVPRATILAIIRNPANYYVNVHNADFPAGALRGQLRR